MSGKRRREGWLSALTKEMRPELSFVGVFLRQVKREKVLQAERSNSMCKDMSRHGSLREVVHETART